MLRSILKFLGLYHAVKHPCPDVFRMSDLTPLGADLLALHMRNVRNSYGNWGR